MPPMHKDCDKIKRHMNQVCSTYACVTVNRPRQTCDQNFGFTTTTRTAYVYIELFSLRLSVCACLCADNALARVCVCVMLWMSNVYFGCFHQHRGEFMSFVRIRNQTKNSSILTNWVCVRKQHLRFFYSGFISIDLILFSFKILNSNFSLLKKWRKFCTNEIKIEE